MEGMSARSNPIPNATARPNRSAGPRPRPGSTNATSAGANGNPRSRASSSSANTCVADRGDTERGPDPQLRRLPSHIRPIFGEYYATPCSGSQEQPAVDPVADGCGIWA